MVDRSYEDLDAQNAPNVTRDEFYKGVLEGFKEDVARVKEHTEGCGAVALEYGPSGYGDVAQQVSDARDKLREFNDVIVGKFGQKAVNDLTTLMDGLHDSIQSKIQQDQQLVFSI